jgi:hypothetical protein
LERSLADLSDIRYLVAHTRYESTQLIRTVLLKHFEDVFTTSEAVLESAKAIEALAEKVGEAVQQVLQVGSNLPRAQLQDIYQDANLAEPAKSGLHMGSIWRLSKEEDRPYVVGFAIWAASLMHLMLHKAYCVLYFPLAKDQQSALGAEIRPA